MRGGKRLITELLKPDLLEKYKRVYEKEEDPKLRQKIIKFWITLIDNCFLKQPKELAFEEAETNFGFYFLRNLGSSEEEKNEGNKEDKKEEKKQSKINETKEEKGGEMMLNNLLHKESKAVLSAAKLFTLNDAIPLIPLLSSIIEEISKLLSNNIPYVKIIEKSQIIMLLSKFVRLNKEPLHSVIIKNQLIEKSLVI